MKHLFVFFFFNFLITESNGQATIKKPTTPASVKSIVDFGAKPNDTADDTWAFIKAGKYFSNLWDINGVPLKKGVVNFDYTKFSAQLNMPAGTFNVGRLVNVPATGLNTTYGAIFGYPKATAPLNVTGGAAYKLGLELIVLQNPDNNIDEFTIQGAGKSKTKIRYNNNLVTGYFGSKGEPLFFPKTDYDNKYVVTAGHFFYTAGSKNIVLQHFEVDGNNTDKAKGGTMNYNGGWDVHLIQMGSVGAYIVNTKNVTISETSMHHMALDGIMFQDYYKDPSKHPNQANSNLLIRNSNFNYNRRQGLSWIGGRKVTVVNSTFNNTGITVTGLAAGNPAAGIDIEPEKDPAGNITWCMDGRFINCESVNNNGVALGNDYPDHSKNMVFDSCYFHDVVGYAVWIRGKQYQFNNCKIWGGFIYGNEGKSPEDATVFNNCDFADEEILGRAGVYNKGFSLIGNWQYARRMKFNNCSFRTIHTDQKLATIYTPSALETEFNVFTNCKFTIGVQSNGNNMFFGCVFEGNNTFVSNNTKQTEVVNINGGIFTGSDNACDPHTFSISGKIMMHPANSHGMGLTQFILGRKGIGTNNTDGFLNFNIEKNAALYGYWNQAIDIGKNANFINHNGGQVALLSGTFNNNGKLVFEDGSYNWFANPLSFNSPRNSVTEFYIGKDAAFQLSPGWASVLKDFPVKGQGISQMKIASNAKIDGDHPSIPIANKGQFVGSPLLNGKDEFVKINNPGTNSKLSNYALNKAFSLEMVFTRSVSSRDESLFRQGELHIFFKGNQLFYNLPGASVPVSTAIFIGASDTMHMFTFLRDADNLIHIYLDGKNKYSSKKAEPGIVSSNNNIELGSSKPGFGNLNFKGKISRLRIWSRALSSEEICYNSLRSVPLKSLNLVADWWINSNSSTITDQQPSSINGRLMKAN